MSSVLHSAVDCRENKVDKIDKCIEDSNDSWGNHHVHVVLRVIHMLASIPETSPVINNYRAGCQEQGTSCQCEQNPLQQKHVHIAMLINSLRNTLLFNIKTKGKKEKGNTYVRLYQVCKLSNETDFLFTKFLFFSNINVIPFKIVPLGSYTPMETLFPLLLAVLEVFNQYGLQHVFYTLLDVF